MHLTYVTLHEVTWSMVVWCIQNLRRDGNSFMWHQPCQRCKYTTSVDIQKTRHIKLITHVESHASAVSLLKRAQNSDIIISDHQSIKNLHHSLSSPHQRHGSTSRSLQPLPCPSSHSPSSPPPPPPAPIRPKINRR